MALQLNLLHEAQLEEKQRQRDPLKLGFLALILIGAAMVAYYMWNGYQTLQAKRQLAAVQREWAKVEPKVKEAAKRSAELTQTISTTRVLDEIIDQRFYWAPFLERVARCITPNIQLTSLDGSMGDANRLVNATLEGVAAATEPRAAAEDMRQLLIEQLSGLYPNAKVEFKSLEDLDTMANVAGVTVPMARYVLTVSFANSAVPEPTPTPAPARGKKR